MKEFRERIFDVTDDSFLELALDVFHFQYQHNHLYRAYADATNANPRKIDALEKIPFLPISFFKSHEVKTTSFKAEIIFESSGITQTTNSRHLVKEKGIYQESFVKGFEKFYGPISDYCVLGLLPSYLERKNSSLIAMVDEMIKISTHPLSAFYLYEHEKLDEVLGLLEKQQQKTLLIGVTFALLDFAEEFPQQLKNTIVMETGGMKGRRKELTREESHEILKKRLGVPVIHSEYGMTELLSQAYSKGEGKFEPVPWMKILTRSEDDPFEIKQIGSGIVNVIDLANIYSCSFLATDDAGKVFEDGSFEIAGRVDNSDIRGCSLLVL